MPVIRACSNCGLKNRIPAKHLASTGRCGACKSSIPPVAEPMEVDEIYSMKSSKMRAFPYLWTSG